MDARLSWPTRLGIRLHLLYCVWCRRYARQLQLLRKATGNLSPESLAEPAQLSSDAKAEMRARLQEALKQPPPPGQ